MTTTNIKPFSSKSPQWKTGSNDLLVHHLWTVINAPGQPGLEVGVYAMCNGNGNGRGGLKNARQVILVILFPLKVTDDFPLASALALVNSSSLAPGNAAFYCVAIMDRQSLGWMWLTAGFGARATELVRATNRVWWRWVHNCLVNKFHIMYVVVCN